MRYDGEEIRSVSLFLDAVQGLHREQAQNSGHPVGAIPIWFRGTSKATHLPIPSIGRDAYSIDHERPLLNLFKQNAVPVVAPRPQSEWEWLFLMRHHDVPTRLLDWTESPLVALYFGTLEGRNLPGDGAVWTLYPTALNHLSGVALTFPGDLPIFDHEDDALGPYAPSELRNGADRFPLAGIAPKYSARMEAQHSVFTITHRQQVSLETVGAGDHIGRFVIPQKAKATMRRELQALMISRYTVFPELDSVGALARSRFDDLRS